MPMKTTLTATACARLGNIPRCISYEVDSYRLLFLHLAKRTYNCRYVFLSFFAFKGIGTTQLNLSVDNH